MLQVPSASGAAAETASTPCYAAHMNRSQRAAGPTVAIATKRAANGFGISAVLNRDRERDGGIARGSVGV